jgi:hypothetical protein
MARFRHCPKCGDDAVPVVAGSERFDAQARVWTGEQACSACGAPLLYKRNAETQEERDMAKRGAHRINTVKGNGGRPESREVAPRLAKAGRPRNKPLPGMEDARIGGLDDICASIAETREQMNQLRTDEAGHLRTALGLMRKNDKTTWRAAGVELARVPGEEKLRVRTTKEKATAETEDEDHVADDGDDEVEATAE